MLKKISSLSLLFVLLLSTIFSIVLATFVKPIEVNAGPSATMPAHCTPGTPSASSTYCAGVNLSLTDANGSFQSRWAGQYWVHTSSSEHYLAYCLRDDLGHPVSTSDGGFSFLIDKNGNFVNIPVNTLQKYNYVLWKYGDTTDANTAAAVWMLGHYYIGDQTASNHVLINNLNATNNAAVNALAAGIDAEATTYLGNWSLTVDLNAPIGWTGALQTGTVHLQSANGAAMTGYTINLTVSGGTLNTATVVTDGAGNATFDYTSPGTTLTVEGSIVGPSNFRTIDPPGLTDQLVGTYGATQTFIGNDSATPLAAAPDRFALGDYVWIDSDRTGDQDPAETPVQNVQVQLLNSSNAVYAATSTDINGHYVFDNLLAGTYRVRFSNLPSYYVVTTKNGTAVANDSNVNIATVTTDDFLLDSSNPNLRAPVLADGVVIATQIDPTIDMGIYRQSMDLNITKTITSSGPYKAGGYVDYEIVVKNLGPDNAQGGWKVTDLLQTGLTFKLPQPQSGSHSSFSCIAPATISGGASMDCTSTETLSPNESIKLLLSVSIDSNVSESSAYKNFGYVTPAAGDLLEDNILVIPDFTTVDTSTTATNNDASAVITISTSILPPNTGRFFIMLSYSLPVMLAGGALLVYRFKM